MKTENYTLFFDIKNGKDVGYYFKENIDNPSKEFLKSLKPNLDPLEAGGKIESFYIVHDIIEHQNPLSVIGKYGKDEIKAFGAHFITRTPTIFDKYVLNVPSSLLRLDNVVNIFFSTSLIEKLKYENVNDYDPGSIKLPRELNEVFNDILESKSRETEVLEKESLDYYGSLISYNYWLYHTKLGVKLAYERFNKNNNVDETITFAGNLFGTFITELDKLLEERKLYKNDGLYEVNVEINDEYILIVCPKIGYKQKTILSGIPCLENIDA